MTFRWNSQGVPMRKPLQFQLCGGYVSGLLSGYTTPQFYPKYGNPRAWQSGGDMPVPWQPNTFYYSSSDFTGVAHAVAQVLMGATKAPDLFAGAAFRADWAHTHGIYSQDIGNNQRRPWIISINSAGIYARVLPHCAGTIGATPTGTEKAWDAAYVKSVYGFYPQITPDGFFTLPGDWTQLADSAEVAAFYSKSAIYDRCGWAFDSDGSHAVNTAYTTEDTGTEHGYRFWEYIVSLSFDIDGNPTGASMAASYDGYARYTWNGTSDAPCHLAVPNSNGQLSKFDFSLSDTVKTVLGADGEQAPLVSWYSATDQIDGLVHINSVITTDETVDESGNLGALDALPLGVYEEHVGSREAGQSGGVFLKGAVPPAYSGQTGTTTTWYTNDLGYHARLSTPHLLPSGETFGVNRITQTWGEGAGTFYEHAGFVPVGDRAAAYAYAYHEDRDHAIKAQDGRGLYWAPPGNVAGTKHYRPLYSVNCGTGGTCGGTATTSTVGAYQTENDPVSVSGDPRSKANFSGTMGYSKSTVYGTALLDMYCPDRVPQNFQAIGFCQWAVESEYESALGVPDITGGDYNDATREESLVFRSANQPTDVTVFDRIEGPIDLDTQTFQTILAPIDGNDYLFKTPGAERMYCWSDSITGQIAYSDKMDGDTGADLRWVDSGGYPLASLPASPLHSWIGVPGDST